MKKNIVWAVVCMMIAFGIVACGGSGGGGGGTPSKNLFSLWKDTTDSSPLDLRGGWFGSPPIPMNFIFSSAAVCNCDMTITGDQSSGAYAITACAYQTGIGSPATDPGCSTLVSTGNYTLSSNILNICETSPSPSCGTYK